MNSQEIRMKFLEYFESKNHKIIPSAPLVVKNDPTLMFINAGMNPFKDIFLGNVKADNQRVADTQKCLRVSGKHNDLEEVGVDTYHHTMFEMLGNWSFGDYFKKDAIEYAWELLTEVYKLPKDRLYVTIFEGSEDDNLHADNEAKEVWKQYVSEDRILNGSKADNFWEMGETGPCGPCSEIHFDNRSDEERSKVSGDTLVNEDHPQVIEIWNLVFIQYNRLADKSLQELPAKHIDTGMGFERLVRVIQGKTSNYDTDIFMPLINQIESLSGKKYGFSDAIADVSFRVIADHIRAIAFSIADGQIPSNTGAGYVIRRILRRAVRYGSTHLGFEEAFLYKLVATLATQMNDIFPELKAQNAHIKNIIEQEEKSFFKTLVIGEKIFQQKIADLNGKLLSGTDAFELYDTYGFPYDLTELMARENGLSVDKKEFDAELKKQKDRSRNATKIETDDWIIVNPSEGDSEFVGYEDNTTTSKIMKYRKISQKGKEQYQIVLDKTPFYAESGGQVGDVGTISDSKNTIKVINTLKENTTIIHYSNDNPQELRGEVEAKINVNRRNKIAKNHSATHLMHAALREVLGTHVEQKGSLVNDRILRFDFSLFSKVTDEEIEKIEDIVNQKISQEIPSTIETNVALEDAKSRGVTALFGEKYGEYVRVVTFDAEFSQELCGGTHIKNTIELGCFKILSESSIASGIRRVEATTSFNAIDYYKTQESKLKAVSKELKNPENIVDVVKKMVSQQSAMKKDNEKLQQKIVVSEVEAILAKGENYIFHNFKDYKSDMVKGIAMELRKRNENLVCIFTTTENDKLYSFIAVGDNVKDKFDAKEIAKELAPIVSGGGGGQPTFSTVVGKSSTSSDEVKSYFGNLIR